MSRIGKLPILLPIRSDMTIEVKDGLVHVKGPLGELFQQVPKKIYVELYKNQIFLKRASDSKKNKSLHGLYRSLLNNMVIGVSHGFSKELELVGVGYKVSVQGQILELALGFSHNIMIELPSSIKITTKIEKGKNPIIRLTSYDKQLLGLVAAKIRSFRKPEPYKGKGIRYLGEYIRRKSGKSA